MFGRALIRRCGAVEKPDSTAAPGNFRMHGTAALPMEPKSAAGYTRLWPHKAGADRNRRTRPGGQGMPLRSLLLVLAVVLHASLSFGQDLLQTGIDAYRRGDYVTALKVFRTLADQGNANGQNTVGILYGRGLGVPVDLAEAVRWFRRAAEQGHTVAQHNLGAAYFRGRGVLRDDAEAIRWFRKAAGKGHAASSHNLGFAYFTGRGVPVDNAEAALWFRRAAMQGLARAQYNLGYLYYRGEGVLQDHVRAFVWTSLASDQGYAPAVALRLSIEPRLTRDEIARAGETIGKILSDIRAARRR